MTLAWAVSDLQGACVGNWTVQHILYPCGPFLLGLLFRCIAVRRVSCECFGTVELALSMAVISLLILTLTVSGLRRRRDTILATTVASVYSITAVGFAGLFSMAVYEETRVLSTVGSLLSIPPEGASLSQDLAKILSETTCELDLLRSITLGLSFLLVLGTVWAARRLKFTD